MEKDTKNIFEGAEGVFETLQEIEGLTVRAETVLKESVHPLRQSLIKRFPVFFLCLVTVGFASVSFALEHIFKQYKVFENNPFLLFLGGILILVVTGAAYKSR